MTHKKGNNTAAVACTAFGQDIEETFEYMDAMKVEAAKNGHIARPGRGNKGLQISFRVALHYRMQSGEDGECVDAKTAFKKFKEDFSDEIRWKK